MTNPHATAHFRLFAVSSALLTSLAAQTSAVRANRPYVNPRSARENFTQTARRFGHCTLAIPKPAAQFTRGFLFPSRHPDSARRGVPPTGPKSRFTNLSGLIRPSACFPITLPISPLQIPQCGI